MNWMSIHIRTLKNLLPVAAVALSSQSVDIQTVQLAMFLEEGNNIVEHFIATDCAE